MSASTVPGQKLHHIGFVVASISQAVERFAAFTGGSWDGRVFDDPIQTVRVTFIRPSSPLDPLIELVEPVGADSRVSSFLKRGGGLHHLCYEVEDLEAHLAHERSLGGLIVQPPAPAVAYDGRRIAWVYTPDKLLLEYLESRKDGERGTQGRD